MKKGAVTSLAVASSGTSVNLAAGTSKGEVVVWRFPSPEEEPGEASDSEEEASAPPPPPKRTSWWGGGGKKAAPASTPKRERRTPKPPAEPFVLARAQVQRAPGPGEGTQVENRRTRTLVALLRGDVRGVVRGRVAIVLRRARRHVAHVVPRRRRRRALREENVVQNSYGRDAGALVVASRVVVAASGREAPPPRRSRCLTIGAVRAPERPILHRKRRGGSSRRSWKSARRRRRRRGRRASRRGNSGRATRRRCLRFSRRTPSPVANPSRCSRVPTVTSSAPRPPPDPRPSATRRAPPASGKVQRELAMFRGAKTWARRSTFAAVERERRLADADEAGAPNDESDVDVDDDVVAGASTLVPTRRLDNAAHRGGGDSSGARRDAPDGDGKDWEHVRGSTFVAGTDDLLSVAENYGSGAGGYMARSERRALVSPETHPLHPGRRRRTARRRATRTPRTSTAATRPPSCFWTCSRTRGVCSRWTPRG